MHAVDIGPFADAAPSDIVIEEMTFGKLFNPAGDAPEDLHVTSRSKGVDDRMLATLLLPSLLQGRSFTSARIDPKSASAGVFLIRPLRLDAQTASHVALVRARMRDHISPTGARRAHPQLVASVVRIRQFAEFPFAIIEAVQGKAAERVSMAVPQSARFGFSPTKVSVKSLIRNEPAPIQDAADPALLALLNILFPPWEVRSRPQLNVYTFGSHDFADENAFLKLLGKALTYLGVRDSLWSDLTIAVGLDVEFPGIVIRYMPSLQSAPIRLGTGEAEKLRERLKQRRPSLRLLAPGGMRSTAVLKRHPLQWFR